MKSVNVRKIASVGAGAAMIAAAFAGAVQTDTTNLASFPFYSNGEPNVKIVVGGMAMPSDAVAAANIAAMIGNLAYTAKEISVLGVEGLGTSGGSSTGTSSASLEVTTPGVNPNVAFQMKTYIGGYLSYNTVDTKSAYTGASSILSSDGTTFGRRVTNYETPQLVNKITVTDASSSKTYTEEERYMLYANAAYDSSAKAVKAKNGQVAYEAQFTNPIQYCTDATPSTIVTAATCEDQYQTDKHRLKIKFLGSDWVIQSMTTSGTGTSATISQVILGKEVQYKEFMQIGDESTAPNGVKAKLTDISGLATGSNFQPPVTFEIYDADGNKIDTATLQEGATNEYNKNGIVIHLWTAFSGLGGNNYAQVSMYSDKLTLNTGQTVDTDNNQWSVTIVSGGTGYGASISRIQLTRIVIDDISEGGSVAYITKPQLMKLTFNGLEPVSYDTLSFGTGSRNFPVTSTDATTLDQSYIRISSSLSAPFQFSDTNANTIYYVTDGTNVGASGIGTIFYQNTNGYFTPYYSSTTGYISKGFPVLNNGTVVSFGTGTNTTSIVTIANLSGDLCGPGTAVSTFAVDWTLTSATAANIVPYGWNFSSTGATLNSSIVWTSASGTGASDYFNTSCTTAVNWNVTLPAGVKLTSPLPASSTAIRYNVTVNYVPYTYSSRTVYMKFNSTNLNGTATTQAPTSGNEVIGIPEEQFDNDNGTTTNWQFHVYDASAASPKMATASGTTYFYYGGTGYEGGYVSPRGSKGESISSTSASIKYATTLAHALYTLAKAGTETTGNSATTDFKIGESALNDGGYSVVVKGVSAGGVAGGQISGIENLRPSVATADSVVNLNTASTPLVVLDSQASTTQPLIVVGGPMVNSVASTVLGGRSAMTAGTEAMVKVYDDKIVVAGYMADDTMAAANALINWMASNKDNIQGRA
ncbi:MAG: S-layer protein [Candidatus Micrarchaeota archaeon]